MKRAILTALAICGAVAAHAATLHWRDGESMEGDLVEATGTTATWQSPLFESPLILGWPALRKIDWPARQTASTDPFVISLRDGSSLHADIVSISGSSVFIHGSRYGDVELKGPEILSARRTSGGTLLWSGPAGDAGWKPMNNDDIKGGHGSEVGPGASFVIPYFNRGFQQDLKLPDSMDVEFHLHSTERPNFRFTFEDQNGAAFSIETWGDEIVAALGHDFKLIRKMQDSERSEALRFTWDTKARHAAFYTPGGDLITDWQPEEDHSSSTPGMRLFNKGRDLSLDFLRIRTGAGNPPAKFDMTHPRVEMDDGAVLDGAVLSGSAGVLQLSATTVALNHVDSIVFSTDAPAAKPAMTSLIYGDGTYLLGNLDNISKGAATLETAFSAQPLVARTDAIRQMRVVSADAPAPPSLAELDQLTIQGTTFHGKLAAGAGDGPQWLPVGAVGSAAPAKGLQYEIVRHFPDDAPASAPTALFYMRTGDVLPGVLRSIDRDGVDIDSGITEQGHLPGSELKAIQFDVRGRMNMKGFDDPAWRVIAGADKDVSRTGDSIVMNSGCSIGHPGAMQAHEISFTMKNGSFAGVRLRMFCAGTDPAKSTNLLVVTTGGQVMCGLEADPGQFDEPRIQVSSPSSTVAVRLVIKPAEVELYLNGAHMQTFPVPAEGRHGVGLILEAASVWGNNVRSVEVDHFSTSSQPGATWLPEVAPDAKEQALTVPRFRREDPPRHALIAANGDVLRGEIEAATATNFAFRAGTEELTVPRDRVKAVIWLGKPVESGTAQGGPSGKEVTLKRLQDPMRSRIFFGTGLLENAIGYLKSEAPELQFKFPKDPTQRNGAMQIGNEPLANALERICTAFDYQYHVDENGVIVIERQGSVEEAPMVEKTYWLKPGSFPAGTPVDKTLAAKGVPFPAGAAATWTADAGQLSVRNTQENQDRVAQVLASDFGGGLGSPTHWLLLESGARIALAVDKFDKDVITGHHPVYGRCTIPAADVVAIRSFPMEPGAVMKSLDGWRLVYAPEPVLPEAGGDDSALVGKAAPTFKLNLLAGGQFDLAKQKGKVVVLDFWATWCGPCVHSLPGLIQAMSGFTPDRVTFVAVNQDEPGPHVKQFIDARGWNVSVALDDGGHVGQQYGADAIPHTVIIGPDGKIAWVKTGSTPGGEDEAAKEVNQLLAAPAPR